MGAHLGSSGAGGAAQLTSWRRLNLQIAIVKLKGIEDGREDLRDI